MKNKFEIRGEVTAIIIKRSNGLKREAIIDTADLPKVQEFPNTWVGWWDPTIKSWYVVGYLQMDGKRVGVRLHRWIMDAPKNLEVDHINHDTLNNCRTNLRLATRSENTQNRKGPNKQNSTGYIGVDKRKDGRYRASVRVNGKMIHLGLFEDVLVAAEVAREARARLLPYSQISKTN